MKPYNMTRYIIWFHSQSNNVKVVANTRLSPDMPKTNVANTQAKLYSKFITESNWKFQTKTKNIIFSLLFLKKAL